MAKWIEDPQGRLEVEKVTEEIKLPVWKANYKGKFREFWNECWEKIEDSFLKLKKSNEGKEPAIEDKQTAFNKAFGTVEDTVLEGNKFTQMTGKDYGGILNIAGQKEAGKAYWDNNTKKLYICKNNNSDISPNVNNYIPFDSNSLLERLENLLTFDNFNSQNQGWFKIAGRLLVYGSFEYKYGTSSIQNFELSLSIPNWQYANVIVTSTDIDTANIISSFQARLSNSTTLSIKGANSFSGKGVVSYLIIARV